MRPDAIKHKDPGTIVESLRNNRHPIVQGAKELLDAIGHNDFIGLTIIDKNGKILYRNEKHDEFSDIKSSDVIGRHISCIPGEKLSQVLETGLADINVYYITRLGNKGILNRIPLHDKDGHLIGAMTITLIRLKELEEIIHKYKRLKEKLKSYKGEVRRLQSARYSFSDIIGAGAKNRDLISRADKYAGSDYPIIITGESGSGKELLAHSIHLASPRNKGAFVIVNCPAIPEELIESELFGYEAGAFTGARKNGKMGKLEMANGGTLFFDEISSLNPKVQPKLLRVLQDQRLEKIGSNGSTFVDFRIISATNQDIMSLVNAGTFRHDLYYRLNVLALNVPPLREKREDIPALAHNFFHLFANEDNIFVEGISEEALDILDEWSWPGNIRELRNVLRAAAVNSETGVIQVEDLPHYLRRGSSLKNPQTLPQHESTLTKMKQDAEKSLVEASLLRNDWNKAKTARELGISRPLLYSIIKKYQLSRLSGRGRAE